MSNRSNIENTSVVELKRRTATYDPGSGNLTKWPSDVHRVCVPAKDYVLICECIRIVYELVRVMVVYKRVYPGVQDR